MTASASVLNDRIGAICVRAAVKNVDVSLTLVINIGPADAMPWKQALTSDEKTRQSQLCDDTFST